MKKDRQDLLEAGQALGPLTEIMRQVKAGDLTAKQLQLVAEHSNPFSDDEHKICQRIRDEVQGLGGFKEDLLLFLLDKELVEKVAKEIICAKLRLNKYKVIVDYSKTLDEMIKAGKYDECSDEINIKNFSIKDTGKHEVELVLANLGLADKAWIDEPEKYLDSLGLMPASIEHLLAFGSKYPDVQRKFPIIALGSVFEDARRPLCAPCLYLSDIGRRLFIYWNKYANYWDTDCHFLAFFKAA